MTENEFADAVEEALAGVPERFRAALDNVGVAVADEPTARELASAAEDGELLGLYEGVPLTQRTSSYGGVMPDVITVFQGPHERICSTRSELVAQIRVTVLHELGHYFGFDDDYLHAHGY